MEAYRAAGQRGLRFELVSLASPDAPDGESEPVSRWRFRAAAPVHAAGDSSSAGARCGQPLTLIEYSAQPTVPLSPIGRLRRNGGIA